MVYLNDYGASIKTNVQMCVDFFFLKLCRVSERKKNIKIDVKNWGFMLFLSKNIHESRNDDRIMWSKRYIHVIINASMLLAEFFMGSYFYIKNSFFPEMSWERIGTCSRPNAIIILSRYQNTSSRCSFLAFSKWMVYHTTRQFQLAFKCRHVRSLVW